MGFPTGAILTAILLIQERIHASTTYSDLIHLNASCAPLDTCNDTRSEDTLLHFRCECKPICADFNTCCIDSPNRLAKLPQQKPKGYCHRSAVFVANSCRGNWRGSSVIRFMCETPSKDMSDPLSVTPVTNVKSGMSYQNYFCAVCNGDSQPLEFWDIKIQKLNSNFYNATEITDNWIYDADTNQWGLLQENNSGQANFTPVVITFELPSRFLSSARSCVQNLRSTCHDSWTDDNFREKCSDYMAIVYSHNGGYHEATPIAYRNIHCLICNFENYTENTVCMKDDLSSVSRYRPEPTRRPLPSTFLMDITLSYSNRVGEVDSCKSDQIYDPFFRKCRKLVCGLPGIERIDEICTQVSQPTVLQF